MSDPFQGLAGLPANVLLRMLEQVDEGGDRRLADSDEFLATTLAGNGIGRRESFQVLIDGRIRL